MKTDGASSAETAVPPTALLWAKLRSYLTPKEQAHIAQAIEAAAQAHAGYERLEGLPYITHSLAVATILADWHAPLPVLTAALLHDVLKPQYAQGVTLEKIRAQFGEEVAGLVFDTSRLGRLGATAPILEKATPQERMEFLTAQLPWVALTLQRSPLAVVIKLADKLHNFQSIHVLPAMRRHDFAKNVMSIFVPFAERLGMRTVKRTLEDEAFAILNPEAYAKAQTRFTRAALDEATTPWVERIQQALNQARLAAEVFPKHRSLYDLYRLNAATEKPAPLHLGQPIVICTADNTGCYQALGILHQLWPPEPGSFWDYIAAPKMNGYKALHTRVHIRPGEWLLVALRSEQMELVADFGITALWRDIPVDLRVSFPKWQEPPPDMIGVLTPDGDFKLLPVGSTPIDFAYAIHDGLGHQCTGALVNGRQVPLAHVLESGDVVHILTSKAAVGPQPEWLTVVKSSRAQKSIRRWLRLQKPEDAVAKGQLLLDEAMRRVGLLLTSPEVTRRLTAVAGTLGHKSAEDLFLSIGLNLSSPEDVVTRLNTDTYELLRVSMQATVMSLANADMPQRFASCCRPQTPDALVAYQRKDGIITIHRADCVRVRHLKPLLQCDWNRDDTQPRYEVEILATDRAQLVKDVSSLVADFDLNMTSFHADRISDGSARIQIGLGDIPRWQIDNLLDHLRQIRSVRQATLGAPTLPTHINEESVLARHLSNPYSLRPVTGRDFYGRRQELLTLINNLRDVRPGEAVLLWGPRRIGKTSLLLEFQKHIASGDYVIAFIDMQQLSGRSTTMFLRTIMRAIADTLGDSVKPPRISHLKKDPIGYFRGFLDNVPALQNRHLVLIFDEFQLLAHLQEEEASLADINRTFRNLIQHRGGLSIIFSGGGVLENLLRLPDTSFMLEVARYQKVDCLDETAARQLVVEPVSRIQYDPDVVDALLTLTARHPYYLQWLCGELVFRAVVEERHVVQMSHLQQTLDTWMVGQGEQYFNHLWGSSSGFTMDEQKRQKLVLTAVATLGTPSEWLKLEALHAELAHDLTEAQLWDVLRDLVRMDTLLVEQDRYRIQMPLFEQWLQANYTVAYVRKEGKS